jgi:membrane fusion protein (multidrug efflux system)
MRPFIFVLHTSLIILYIVGGCKETKQAEIKKKTVDSVAAFILKKELISKDVSFPAELLAMERTEILAKFSAYVKSVRVEIGDRVQKGQVLATLEAPEMISNFAQANADLQSARSRYQGSLDTYKRILNASKVEGTIAANELEKARNQMMADSAAMEANRSKLTAYGQINNYLTLRAPFAGIVTQRNVDPGTLVSAGNPLPILVVENNSALRLRVPVPETYAAAVSDSSFIRFTVEAQPGVTYKAKLSRKSGALDLRNRTEIWEYIYPNKEHHLKSGMFANATLHLGRSEPSFVIPSSAVSTNLEKRFVIRLREGKTEWIDVKQGMASGDKVEVFGNMQENDTLLIRATDEIKPDTKLLPKIK